MASKLSISKERTAELVKEFGKGEGDSGSPVSINVYPVSFH